MYDKNNPLLKQPIASLGGRTNSVDYNKGAMEPWSKQPNNFLSPVYSSWDDLATSVLGFQS